MKVIGIVEKQAIVLCEMTTKELGNIAGQKYDSNKIEVVERAGKVEKKDARNVDVGDHVSISPIFADAKELTESHAEVKKLLSQVKAATTRYENAVTKKD